MKSKAIWLCAILLAATVIALAQRPPQPGQPQQPAEPAQPAPLPATAPPQRGEPQQPPPPAQPFDPIARNLFPPEMVMQHRRELGLTEEQKTAIKDEAIKASTRFSEFQWQMQDEMEKMDDLTKGANIDEQKVLAELDKILAIEREVKRTQLALSIRIKNKLTTEQQAQLWEIQRNIHAMPRQ
jgi:Spy/CpxP family protein refolding chaperone